MADSELVGVAEIAALQKVASNTAWRWTQRDDFPDPVARLAAGPVYRWADVQRWAAAHLPLPRGPAPKR